MIDVAPETPSDWGRSERVPTARRAHRTTLVAVPAQANQASEPRRDCWRHGMLVR